MLVITQASLNPWVSGGSAAKPPTHQKKEFF